MALELIYTSAERGLRAGTSGFCTVAMSRALQPGLVPRLEALGGYRPGPTGDGPVARSFWRIEMSGGVAHVLSIVGPAPPDHTQRTNKIATYLVLGQDELDDAGPAWMLAQPGAVRTAWSGPAAWIEQPARAPGGGPSGLRRAAAWEAACGDAGWAGVLASAFLRDQGKPAHVIVPAGLDPLPLVDDAMHLLPPWARWRATFTTYFLQPVAGVQCAWRFCVDGTPGAEQARQSKGLVIDLAHAIGQAPDSRFVRMARTGTDPEGDAEAARQRRDREARAAAERARAAQIRVVADPRTAPGATAPRTPVTPRGLPIELDEPIAPSTVGLTHGTKVALGVGGGVLVLAIVAFILIATFSGQKQGGSVNPPPALPSQQPQRPVSPSAPEPTAAGAETQHKTSTGGAVGAQAGQDHDHAKGAEADPPEKKEPPPTPKPDPSPPVLTRGADLPPEPAFPTRLPTNFATVAEERLESKKVIWKARWSGTVPQASTATVLVPGFMQEIVADASVPSKSKVVMVGTKPAITLVNSSGKVYLEGNEALLPDSLPRGWMPTSAESLLPRQWLRLVVGRMIVEDGSVRFQADQPQIVELAANDGEARIPDVVDDALWVEVQEEGGSPCGAAPQRARRAKGGEDGRMVEIKLGAGTLVVDLPADEIGVRPRFDSPRFEGSTPTELQEKIAALTTQFKARKEDLAKLAQLRDTLRTGHRPNSIGLQELVRQLDGYCQSMTDGELNMLVDGNGKPVPWNRKSAGATSQVALEIDKVHLVRGWAPALDAMWRRMGADYDRDSKELTAATHELAALSARLKQPVAKFRLLGDDGYIIANVKVMPVQPPAKKEGATE